MDNPVVDIHQNARFTLVNLTFEDINDPDLIKISEMVKGFQTASNSIDEKKAPHVAITIMPKEIAGSFIHGVSGVAVLQSSRAGVGPDTASFILANDCIHAYMLDLEKAEEEALC
ncbi:MAG: hypothetical protein IJ683_04480 [Butyrivibrio sp.]|nr:hypothetical protein [Butyrivibrio sp.]MBR1641562.1 hypothetical protein [Butyrivibrio sp.]